MSYHERRAQDPSSDRQTTSGANTHSSDGLFLPDPFVSGQRVVPISAMATLSSASDSIIDLTGSSPPTAQQHREVIDLDAVSDSSTRLPYLADRRPSPSTEAERWSARADAMRGLAETASQVANATDPEVAAQRLRRREWLLQTAERRTNQRENRDRVEAANDEVRRRTQSRAVPGMLGMMPDMLGSGIARFRAFVHGPNGGGPVGNSFGLPTHFLNGSNISFVPQIDRFQHPNLDYGIHNEIFPGFPMPPATVPAKYVPPEPVKEPFTRTFTEADLLICPGCKLELGGSGDEIRRKIWVSKCSHVYCGECGHNLKSGSKKQGIICYAPECGKKITKTKIFEAYV